MMTTAPTIPPPTVRVQPAGSLLRLSLDTAPKPFVEISQEHYGKLAAMHARGAKGRGELRERRGPRRRHLLNDLLESLKLLPSFFVREAKSCNYR